MLQLYNTLSSRLEEFKPLKGKRVGFYACGPTVYDFAHIGNLRTYLFEDVLKRALIYHGYQVRHIMNLTDVDDKTIRRARETRQSLKSLTRKYADFFKQDIKKLNILLPSRFAPATGYIKEMIQLAKKLLEKGFAYEKDDSIYFNIAKFPAYGRLVRLNKQELKAGARVDVDNYEKDNPADFVLWKKWTPKDGKVFWQSPFGKGRPGWHLECSAISVKELGQPFDIHAGAVDLIFPHHENEIAQSEAAFNKPFARYWTHGEHLLVEGQKMAKSLNNFFTLRDLEAKGFNPLAFRYLTLTSHYRSKLNFTWESLKAAQSALLNLYEIVRDWARPSQDAGGTEFEDKFFNAIDNDLNFPEALATVWKMIRSPLPSSAKANCLLKFDQILGLDIKKYLGEKIKIPPDVAKLVKKREKARQRKDWKTGDDLRQEIQGRGFLVEDAPEGQRVFKAS